MVSGQCRKPAVLQKMCTCVSRGVSADSYANACSETGSEGQEVALNRQKHEDPNYLQTKAK